MLSRDEHFSLVCRRVYEKGKRSFITLTDEQQVFNFKCICFAIFFFAKNVELLFNCFDFVSVFKSKIGGNFKMTV
jgi:hypothetical protein